VPGANHVLKHATDRTPMGQAALYGDPATPIMPEVTGAIVDWVTALR